MTTRSHGEASELEISKLLIVLGELTFSLEDRDSDLGLVVSRGGEDLTLLGWDGRVTSDQLGADTSHGLDSEGKWGHIEKKNIFHITSEDSSLDGSANSNSLVGVNASVWLLSEEVLNDFTNLRHSS